MTQKKTATRKNRTPRKTRQPTKTSRNLAKPKASLEAAPAVLTNVKAGAGSSKQATVLGMLRSPEGTTIEAVMQATGWQQHSVRGFFAGVVRKKLKLDLVSDVKEGRARAYRIADRKNVKASQSQAKSVG